MHVRDRTRGAFRWFGTLARFSVVPGDIGAEDVVAEPTGQPAHGERRAHFDGWRSVPVHRIDALRPGDSFEGPAIFEAETTTVPAVAGDRVAVVKRGWLDIALRA
jgi:N-methylhydantoinase A/oxoprolinase/acetone carboxylase beta subunit